MPESERFPSHASGGGGEGIEGEGEWGAEEGK